MKEHLLEHPNAREGRGQCYSQTILVPNATDSASQACSCCCSSCAVEVVG